MRAGGGGAYRLVAHPDLAADLGPGALAADDEAASGEGAAPRPRWVVLGLHPPYFRHEVLGVAFRDLLAGARLVALHANRMWRTARGMEPGLGMVVRGLEYAAGVEATVVGKPARPFFEEALGTFGDLGRGRVIMVGDDMDSDVGGAQGAGLRGVLVRTGKFSEATLAASPVEPDLVVDDLAALARALPPRPAG